jgi:LL-diaminopimelate aminotransferase
MTALPAQALEFRAAARLRALPPYLFVEIDRAKRALRAQGKDVIDLSVGDPDLPSPPHVIAKLQAAAEDAANHRYSGTEGLRELRAAIARWYERRFGVTLDPDTEVLPLIGSKEGLAHLPLALCDPGDAVLVPDPCYPAYRSGVVLAGAEAVPLPLHEEEGWFPDLGAVSQKAAQRAKVMLLNYPNNPTAATATLEQFQEAIALAKTYRIAIAHDAAYSEVVYDGYRAPSFLQAPDAKSIGIEFHSLSKTYNMTGWRIGFVCGNAQLVGALGQLKGHLDSGIFQPIQWAGIAALEGDQDGVPQTLATYQARRDLLIERLGQAGWQIPAPKAALYVWARVPGGGSSMDFATKLLQQSAVAITPGIGFGPSGEGYVRLSLTVPTDRLEEAVQRITKVL